MWHWLRKLVVADVQVDDFVLRYGLLVVDLNSVVAHLVSEMLVTLEVLVGFLVPHPSLGLINSYVVPPIRTLLEFLN